MQNERFLGADAAYIYRCVSHHEYCDICLYPRISNILLSYEHYLSNNFEDECRKIHCTHFCVAKAFSTLYHLCPSTCILHACIYNFLKVLYGFQSICKQKCKHLVRCKWYNWMYLLTFGQCHPYNYKCR